MRKRGRKPVINKVRDSEDWCFVCKDGGDVLICDYKDCLKSYHADCIEKDEANTDSDEPWQCNWHFCCICKRAATFHCYCCPKAVCPKCTPTAEFVVVKQNSGFCPECLDLVAMIEENKDVDSDGETVDFKDLRTYEGLFMDYYATVIKKKSCLTLEDVRAAKDKAKKSEFDAEEFLIGEDDESGSDYEVGREVKKDVEAKHKKDFKVQPPTKKAKSNESKAKNDEPKELQFTGWGSTRLINFLESIGEDTTKEKPQHRVENLIKAYVKKNKLSDPTKKAAKLIFCDVKLESLFEMKVVNKCKISGLLKPHFANHVSSSEEDDDDDEEEEEEEVEEDEEEKEGGKRKTFLESTRRKPKGKNGSTKDKSVCRTPKSSFAAIVAENIKLVYLRKSLLQELSNIPEAFQEKVTGSFVRVKTDPRKYHFELLQVTDANISTSGDSSGEIFLSVTSKPTEIRLSSLSEGDIEESECVELSQKVKDGLIPKPTVAELEKKAKSLHVDITKHWIARELKFLESRISMANEKGRRQQMFEFLDKKKLLQNPTEQSRMLETFPTVKPEELFETPS